MDNLTGKIECQNEKRDFAEKSAFPFLLILLVGALIRFSFLGRLELWADECSSVLTALSPNLTAALVQENNPPLYYLLLRYWIKLFGAGETAVRSLSAGLGTGCIAALIFWGKSMGLPKSAVLWGALFIAFAPLQFHYSQEARAYIAASFFLIMSHGFFALGAVRNSLGSWIAHALLLTAALYTHELSILLVPAYWVAGWILQIGRVSFRKLAVTHCAVLFLYAPWLLFVRFSAKDTAVQWIGNIAHIELILAPLRSVEHFTIGGRMPAYLPLPVTAGVVRATALILFIVLIAAASKSLWRHPATSETRDRQRVLVLFVFCAMPLFLLTAVSLIIRPIYVPGRYDFFAQPAFLLLTAVGAGRLQQYASSKLRGIQAGIGILLIICGLTLSALGGRLLPQNSPPHRPQTLRGEILQRYGRPDDLIVSLGLEGVKVQYQILSRKIKLPMRTFPSDTMNHLGWFNAEEVWRRGEVTLAQDAAAVLSGNGNPARRIWLMPDPYTGRGLSRLQPGYYHERIAQVIFAQLERAGFKRDMLQQDLIERFSRAGILLYER